MHDPYREKAKRDARTFCKSCDAVVLAGRWQAGEPSEGARGVVCPACRRIRDRQPAGIVEVGGPFFRDHEEEISNLICAEADAAFSDHILQRLMSMERVEDGIRLTTTDPHLARRIGKALERAYRGELRLQYADEDVLLRVSWRR